MNQPVNPDPAATKSSQPSSRVSIQGRLWSWYVGSFNLISLECLLSLERPNGGAAIFLRALVLSTATFLLLLGIHDGLDPMRHWAFDPQRLAAVAHERFVWLGAIFSAIYAGLYTRFASQWSYLAGLYNQILVAQVRDPIVPDESGKCDDPRDRARLMELAKWKAGFIEDAYVLHLAGKQMFLDVILSMLEAPGVREAFRKQVSGSDRILAELRSLPAARERRATELA